MIIVFTAQDNQAVLGASGFQTEMQTGVKMCCGHDMQ